MNAIRAKWAIGLVLAGMLLIYPLGRGVRSLKMTRGGMATFTRLLAAGNVQDVAMVRSLCSNRYLAANPIQKSTEGGVIGLPRNIHKNFQVWTEGEDVLVCPTDREGPVYRLVREQEAWKFDGLVGLLQRGRVVVAEE